MSYESTVANRSACVQRAGQMQSRHTTKTPDFSERFRCGASRMLVSRCLGDRFSGVLSRHACFCPFAAKTEALHRGTILRGVLVGGESRVLFSRCFGDRGIIVARHVCPGPVVLLSRGPGHYIAVLTTPVENHRSDD